MNQEISSSGLKGVILCSREINGSESENGTHRIGKNRAGDSEMQSSELRNAK